MNYCNAVLPSHLTKLWARNLNLWRSRMPDLTHGSAKFCHSVSAILSVHTYTPHKTGVQALRNFERNEEVRYERSTVITACRDSLHAMYFCSNVFSSLEKKNRSALQINIKSAYCKMTPEFWRNQPKVIFLEKIVT